MMPNRQILLVDDDVLTQWVMTDVLTQAGFAVVNACRESEAIDLLDASAAEFDLLLTDIDLPGSIPGRSLADHWRTMQPGRPVIYTGIQRGSVIRLLEQHEFFIAKPLDAPSLLRLIDWALEDTGLRPILPAIMRRHQHVH